MRELSDTALAPARSPVAPPRASEGSQKLWDDLRREVRRGCCRGAAAGAPISRLLPIERPPPPPQARKLEGEIDVKLAAFGKLCSGFEYGYTKGESGLATEQVRR